MVYRMPIRWMVPLALVFLFSGGWAQGSSPLNGSVGTQICNELADGAASFRIGTLRENTEAGEELIGFYHQRQCRPAWSEGNRVDFKALMLINALIHAEEEGLDGDDPAYNREAILALMGEIKADPALKNDPAVMAQLDILLSDAYLIISSHLYHGVSHQKTVSGQWYFAPKKTLAWGERLRTALQNNTVRESLEELSPRHRGYQRLKNTLAHYMRMQEHGGWTPIAYDDPKEVERNRPDELRARLRWEGDLAESDDTTQGLREGIISFQLRHGLKGDGIVGNETLEKMNIPLEAKIATIRLNMERMRWMSEEMENRYIEVNVPAFMLGVVEEGEERLTMRAITGRPERPTPIFNAKMTYLVVNPYWRVPETILREDIFPKVRKNIRYLKKERIRIFRHGDQGGKRAISPASINWHKANPNTFPFYLRQEPGPKNALGRIKFMFPNTHDIYIHDTPDKHLFAQTKRSFSSGCIRVEEPLRLAEYLFASGGKVGGIAPLMAGGANQTVSLPKPVMVYISYWTVWADDTGKVQFRDDLYGYDRELAEIVGWEEGIR